MLLVLALFALGLANPQTKAPPEDSQTKLQGAIRALQQQDYVSAEQGFRDVLALDPHSAAAYCNLGVLYAQTGRTDSAIEAFRRARAITPGDPGISLDLGLIYYRREDFAEAITYFEQVLKLDPPHMQAHYLLGMSDFRIEHYAPAVTALEPILKEKQDDLVLLYVLAVCYGKIKRPDDSIQTFNLFHNAGADTPLFHLLLGSLFLDMGNNDTAKDELQKAIAEDPDLPYTHLSLGTAYRRLGLLELAGKEFDIEIAQNPGEALSYEDRGALYLQQGVAPEVALKMFKKALAINPRMPESLAGMAKCYLALDRPTLAIPLLMHAIEMDPQSTKMHYLMGRALLREGNRTEAEKELAEATALNHGQNPANAENKEEGDRLQVLAVPSSDSHPKP